MFTLPPQSENINDFDLLLGRSIRLFQSLDSGVEWRFIQLTAASSKPSGDVLDLLKLAFSEVSFSTKLRLFSTLLSHHLPARHEFKECQENPVLNISLNEEMQRALSSLKQLGKLEELRNRYVHSHYGMHRHELDGTDSVAVFRTKTRANPKKNSRDWEELTPTVFIGFLKMMDDVDLELSQSTGRLLGLLSYDEDKKVG